MGYQERFVGRRVLVTGHTGFKGSWLSLWLARCGASVSGLALDPPTVPSLFALASVASRLAADHRVDIRDSTATEAAIRDAAPEVVFHLAAQPLVPEGYAHPRENFATNVMGTANVLTAAAASGSVKAIVCVTTDKVYHNAESVHPYRECDRLGGLDPYSSSKAAAELVAASLRHSLDTDARIATARAGNMIGGGDFAGSRLVPDAMRAFAAGAPLVLRRPDAVRPFLHVLDGLAGYLRLAAALLDAVENSDGAWNFGPAPGDDLTVGAVAERLARGWGDGAAVAAAPASSAVHEAGILRLDSTKARLGLGWTPVWGLDRALDETLAWYRAWHGGAPMAEITLRQLAAFEAAAGGEGAP
ncbi:CDP-glucose 4,6-dehydratase [Acuticoccus sp. MNP-M23]|uniref:CDP-glucose 4,6-dehydratase n=1 Tax=Acuticoccus sp. MNP-M23 TaxID=3072793 RepID=UPI0028154989|nr:CDP-glucose 4,6-dehydratase [Acuticoccus sp. MNP-M23]WMS43028.1 CDP-glucose 4,6-dehydratase [Acuticoccus sp. MNP-M23]